MTGIRHSRHSCLIGASDVAPVLGGLASDNAKGALGRGGLSGAVAADLTAALGVDLAVGLLAVGICGRTGKRKPVVRDMSGADI